MARLIGLIRMLRKISSGSQSAEGMEWCGQVDSKRDPAEAPILGSPDAAGLRSCVYDQRVGWVECHRVDLASAVCWSDRPEELIRFLELPGAERVALARAVHARRQLRRRSTIGNEGSWRRPESAAVSHKIVS